jgi:mannose-6-phosphate isomerase-like protein (cupin superfamily)
MSSSEPVSIASAEHYTWGEVCDGWHLLKDPSLSVIQERVPPGAGETEHFHSSARQFFYVLKGVATLEFDGHSVELKAGEGCEIPPTIRHRFVNRSAEEVSFLVISSPSTQGDRTNVASGPHQAV